MIWVDGVSKTGDPEQIREEEKDEGKIVALNILLKRLIQHLNSTVAPSSHDFDPVLHHDRKFQVPTKKQLSQDAG